MSEGNEGKESNGQVRKVRSVIFGPRREILGVYLKEDAHKEGVG